MSRARRRGRQPDAPTPSPIGSWEENETHKCLVGLEVSVDERIAWLEEMLAIAHAAGALPKPRDAWGQEIEPSGGEAPTRR